MEDIERQLSVLERVCSRAGYTDVDVSWMEEGGMCV